MGLSGVRAEWRYAVGEGVKGGDDADRPLASVAPPGGWEYGALIMGDAETRGRVLMSRFGGPAYWKRESPYCTTVRQGPRRSRKMCQPARSASGLPGTTGRLQKVWPRRTECRSRKVLGDQRRRQPSVVRCYAPLSRLGPCIAQACRAPVASDGVAGAKRGVVVGVS